MYTLLRRLPRREIVLQQLPGVGSSLVIAEVFYKFGSFSLEVIAFLATWFVLDLAFETTRQLLGDSSTRTVEQ